jgi:hypothetical protein
MSCLFNSFGRIVGENPQAIRGRICDWLIADPALLDDLSASAVVAFEGRGGLNLPAYVARMRSPATWGGAIEIRAFVRIWRRPVRVWAIRGRRWIEFPLDTGVEAAGAECKLSWSGGHYAPILP